MEIYLCRDAAGRAKTKEVSPVEYVPLPWYSRKDKDKRVFLYGSLGIIMFQPFPIHWVH
jgi:hypothetical protein